MQDSTYFNPKGETLCGLNQKQQKCVMDSKLQCT
jgi:hypothetical protein